MQDQYGSSHTGAQIDQAVSMVLSGNAESNNYSTEEHVIGTWIDGKPLYRRVVTGNSGPIAQTNAIATISNIKEAVHMIGVLLPRDANQTDAIPTYGIDIMTIGEELTLYPVDDWHAEREAIVIAEYTKTTD